MKSKVTYRQQYTRCGKERCRKCREGPGHGPYWYAYWSENGRTISKYIGAHLPPDLEHEQQRRSLPSPEVRRSLTTAERRPSRSEARQLLRIHLLGQFRVERRSGNTWREDDSRPWQRRRARALLGCLLCNPTRRMGREQVMEALWPNLDSETAANRLNGAVHELRQLLEPGIKRPASSSLLRLHHDVLELADSSAIWVDADAFEQKLNQIHALSDPQQVEQLLEEAAALYRGDYLLEELYSEWATPRRESLRRRWMGLLLRLAELRVERGALASAIEPLDRLLMSDPTHETAVRQLMLILTRLDRRGEALQAYQRLREVLEREDGSEPLPETRKLYEALRRGEIQPAMAPLLQQATATQEGAPASSTGLTAADGAGTPGSSEQHLSGGGKPADDREQAALPQFPSGRRKQRPLVGRERELAMMRQLLTTLVTEQPGRGESGVDLEAPTGGVALHPLPCSSPHFLLLTGEAGIGKTRLAEELSYEAERQGWCVAWSRSYEQEGTIPYRPWIELLRTLLHDCAGQLRSGGQHSLSVMGVSFSQLQRLGALVPELHEHFPPMKGATPLPAEQERLHLWEATLGLLTALSLKAPLLLVLDDLHWADESSLELLTYLARHLRHQRVLLLATCRDGELRPAHILRALINDLRREQVLMTLAVQPLTASQIAQLVSHLPARVIQSIQNQADGNPFFAEELARYLEREGGEGSTLWQSAPGDGRLHLPDTIAAVLDRRLSKLSLSCQALLSKAAVFGAPFEFNHLLFMDCGQLPHPQEEGVLDLLEEALRAGLLIEEGNGVHVSYHFWHPLIESHLYERLSVARRIQLHRRAASALQAFNQHREQEVAAAITYHLIRGASDDSICARYAEMAANRAYLLAAYGEAQYYYRLAVLALAGTPPPPPVERHPLVETTSLLHERRQDGTPPLDRLLPVAGESELLHFARLLEHIAECCMMQGNYTEARRLYERVIALRSQSLQSEPSQPVATLRQSQRREAQIQAIIWREISLAWFRTGDFAHARDCLERGKQALMEAEATDSPAWACLLLQEGNLYALEGNYSEGRRYVCESLERLEQAMARQQPPSGSSDGGLPTLTERAIAGDPLELGHAHETLGVIAARLGRPAEALDHLHTALEIYEKHECVMAMAQICGNLGAAHALVADHRAARAYMRRALELTERTGDLPNMAFVTGNLGEMARRSGDLVEAEACFRRSLALAERTQEREHMAWCNIALAETLQSAGQLVEALQCLRRSLLTGRNIQHARTIAHALIVAAELRLAQASKACLADLQQRATLGTVDAHRRSGSECGAAGRTFLVRGLRVLRRALGYEGLDAEVALEGRYLEATLEFVLGRSPVAYNAVCHLIDEAGRQENRLILGRAHRLLARILTIEGRHQEAGAHFDEAGRIFRESELLLDYARTLQSYGVYRLALGCQHGSEDQRALASLREARAIFEQVHATIDLQWSELLPHLEKQVVLLRAALRTML